MLSGIHFLNVLLPFLYLSSFVIYLVDFMREDNKIENSKRIFLFLTLFIHGVYAVLRTIEFDHFPITNVFEIFTLVACTISFAYFILELLTDVRGTGMFIIIFSLIFQTVSSIFIRDLREVQDVLRSNLLGFHVFSAVLGYSAITISAIYGGLFLMLYKEIKLSRFGKIFNKLPNLEILEQLSFYSAVIAFISLSVAILIGIVWLPKAFENFSYVDPKLIGTAIIWLVYGIGIFSKIAIKWRGKKVVTLSILGFVIALASTFVSNFLSASFHSFY